jgi:hypothetical protein
MDILQFPAKELTLRQETIVSLHTYSLVQLNRLAYLYDRKNDFEVVALIDAQISKKCDEFDPANTLKRVKKLRQVILGGE